MKQHRTKQLYALGRPVESWVESTPGAAHVYWKDPKGVYLGGNDLVAEKTGMNNRREVIGKTDYHFVVPENLARSYINEDQQVFSSGRIKQFYNYAVMVCDIVTFFTTKIPLLDSGGYLVGTFGVSHYLSDRKLSEFQSQSELSEYVQEIENQMASFNTFGSVPDKMVIKEAQLSKMESRCVYYWSKGLSMKQIARQLSLSPRTVEAYLNSAKRKAGCQYKSELIDVLCLSDLAK